VLCVRRRRSGSRVDDEEVVKKLKLNYHNLWCICKKAEREDKNVKEVKERKEEEEAAAEAQVEVAKLYN
jgi:hypothetical protein